MNGMPARDNSLVSFFFLHYNGYSDDITILTLFLHVATWNSFIRLTTSLLFLWGFDDFFFDVSSPSYSLWFDRCFPLRTVCGCLEKSLAQALSSTPYRQDFRLEKCRFVSICRFAIIPLSLRHLLLLLLFSFQLSTVQQVCIHSWLHAHQYMRSFSALSLRVQNIMVAECVEKRNKVFSMRCAVRCRNK